MISETTTNGFQLPAYAEEFAKILTLGDVFSGCGTIQNKLETIWTFKGLSWAEICCSVLLSIANMPHIQEDCNV